MGAHLAATRQAPWTHLNHVLIIGKKVRGAVSHRSSALRKLKSALRQKPATHAAPKDQPRPLRVVPANGSMPVRPRPLAGGPAETQVMDAVRDADAAPMRALAKFLDADDALTRVLPRTSPTDLPSVHPHTPFTPSSGHPAPSLVLDAVRAAELELDATQVLPVVRALHDGPPSEYWTRVHAAESEQDQPDVDVRTPEQINDHADAMATAFDRHMAALELKARRRDSAIDAFAKRWAHDDRHWIEVAEKLNAKQEESDAGRLALAHADGGTSAALYVVEELSHEIAQRARDKAGVR